LAPGLYVYYNYLYVTGSLHLKINKHVISMAVCIAANIATDVLTSSTSLKETQEA